MFDAKMFWGPQAVKKANKALNSMKLIRKFFGVEELIKIITSNFYSLLYYNSDVWLTYSRKQTSNRNSLWLLLYL
jgi:hypothetical protein